MRRGRVPSTWPLAPETGQSQTPRQIHFARRILPPGFWLLRQIQPDLRCVAEAHSTVRNEVSVRAIAYMIAGHEPSASAG